MKRSLLLILCTILFFGIAFNYAPEKKEIKPESSERTQLFNEGDFFLVPLVTHHYYVDTSGSDSNNGLSPAAPFKTMAKVQSTTLVSGDSVTFKCGQTFNGKINKSTSGIYWGSYGTGAKPIIVYSGSDPLYDRNTFYFTGSNLFIENLNVTYPSQSPDRHIEAYVTIGIKIETGDNNTIQYCDFSLIGTGVFVNDGSNNNNIYQCSFTDMRTIRSDPGGDNDYGSNGCLWGNSNNNTVSHCFFDSCWAYSEDYGIDGGACESYGACSNNKIIYCYINYSNGVMEIGSGTAGTAADNMVAYCKIINCSELTYTSASGGFPVQCKNMQYYNNVIIDTAGVFGFGACFNYAGSETSDTVFNLKNNIFFLKGGIDVVANSDTLKTLHQNNSYSVSSGSSTNYHLVPGEINVSIPATFVNIATYDFHLKPTATSKGAGQTITGSAWTPIDFDGRSIGVPPNNGVYGSIGANTVIFPANVNGVNYGWYRN